MFCEDCVLSGSLLHSNMDKKTKLELENRETGGNGYGDDNFDDVDGKFLRKMVPKCIKAEKEIEEEQQLTASNASLQTEQHIQNKKPVGSSNRKTEPNYPKVRTNENLGASSGTHHKEQRHHDPENDYVFTFKERGLAVIINNENFFKKDESRKGSKYDANALNETFKKLGFEIWPYQDLTAQKMLEILSKVTTNYDHAKACCFVCCILTHGKEAFGDAECKRPSSKVRKDVLYGVDDKTVPTEEVIHLFNDDNCPGLEGKPRLFFFQACRGYKTDSGADVLVIPQTNTPLSTSGKNYAPGAHMMHTGHSQDQPDTPTFDIQKSASHEGFMKSDVTDAQPMGNIRGRNLACHKSDADSADMNDAVRDVPVTPAILYKDCLVMYATPPGYMAWRREDAGSWFIQTLCEVLDNPSIHDRSLLHALVQVIGKVALDYETESDDVAYHEKRGTPVIESMLVKNVYFPESKYRYTFV